MAGGEPRQRPDAVPAPVLAREVDLAARARGRVGGARPLDRLDPHRVAGLGQRACLAGDERLGELGELVDDQGHPQAAVRRRHGRSVSQAALASRRVRVLTIGSLYPPHDEGGGAEIVWHAAVASLRAAGHDVRVLTTDHRRRGRDEYGETEVYRRLRWYWRDHAFPERTLREVLAIELHNAGVVRRHLDDLRPDVVAWWPMGGMSLALLEQVRRAGVPAVSFVHDDWLLYGPKVDAWHARWATRGRAARIAQRLVRVPTKVDFDGAAHYAFASDCTRTRALARHPGLRATSVVNPGIATAFLDPAPPEPWRWRLLYVGRLDPRKGVHTAVEALAELPAAQLSIAGSGGDDDVAALERTVAEAGVGDRVTFLGQRGQAELPTLYAEADAVVFPVEWEEPWGLVPLEAMGCGRPVVATGTGGSGEYLRDGENALLFAAGDASALARCVARLAGDDDLRERLREGGAVTARAHTVDGFNRDVEALLAARAGL